VKRSPFGFEALARDAEHFLLGGIVEENVAAIPIHSYHNGVMERLVGAAGLEADDERAAELKMMAQVVPGGVEGESVEAGRLKIAQHVGGADARVLRAEESGLDDLRVGGGWDGAALFLGPIGHHHGDGSGAATVFGLSEEGNVNPSASRPRGEQRKNARREEEESGEGKARLHISHEQRR
jgi:hypothetical protein